MKSIRKICAASMLAACALSFSAHAQEAPDALVKRVSEEVIATAKADTEIQSGNRQHIMQVVNALILPHTDFQRATALAAGRYWRDATPLQRQQLTDEFRKLLIHTYAGALSQIRDQQIEVKPLRANPGDTEVEVHSVFRQSHGAEPVQVSYRFEKVDGEWKIYDMNVMGAWLVETYKNTFSAEISKGGIDGLIRTLSEKNQKLAAGTQAGRPPASGGR